MPGNCELATLDPSGSGPLPLSLAVQPNEPSRDATARSVSMPATHTILTEIFQYVSSRSGDLEDWCVGVTSDPERRLFEDHRVNRGHGLWTFKWAETAQDARAVERELLRMGFWGATWGADRTSRCVYCYAITTRTRE
ncbi:MAG: hypothetical protein OXN97_04075 [Bryobacterales bacterium]|nr:hypothetical protein [Bryobacterales bacterium]